MKRYPWRDYLENILIAVILALIVRTFFVSGYKVPNHSMAPTVQAGDFVFAWRIPFGIKLPLLQLKLFPQVPERGEVVVFSFPDQPRKIYLKRVVALPGDKVKMVKDQLFINGTPLQYAELSFPQDPRREVGIDNPMGLRLVRETEGNGSRLVFHPSPGQEQSFEEIEVPAGEVFLLGDHRVTSDDSRYWGTVPFERIDGRVFLIWLSLEREPDSPERVSGIRWNRVFRWVE